jgi:hypothetical protein
MLAAEPKFDCVSAGPPVHCFAITLAPWCLRERGSRTTPVDAGTPAQLVRDNCAPSRVTMPRYAWPLSREKLA